MRNDSLAIRDSIREMMFQGALFSMDALQAKTESEKKTDAVQRQQKSGESQNLFFQSRSYYRRALGFDKDYYPAWTNIGTTYYMQDLPKSAIPCYKKALSINPEYSPAWYNLGKVYEVLGKKDSAIYSFKESIRTDSTYLQSYEELSVMIMKNEKDSAAALKLLRLAAHYKPTSEVPWVSMSAVYFSSNDSLNGISCLENATNIYSGDIPRLQILVDYFQNHHNNVKSIYYSNLLASEKKKLEVPHDPGE